MEVDCGRRQEKDAGDVAVGAPFTDGLGDSELLTG